MRRENEYRRGHGVFLRALYGRITACFQGGQPIESDRRIRRLIYAAAEILDADAHCLRHTFESVAFSISPGFAGALTGRALTRDATLNAYLHVDMTGLREVADKVAGRIAAAMAGTLGEVVPYRRARAVR